MGATAKESSVPACGRDTSPNETSARAAGAPSIVAEMSPTSPRPQNVTFERYLLSDALCAGSIEPPAVENHVLPRRSASGVPSMEYLTRVGTHELSVSSVTTYSWSSWGTTFEAEISVQRPGMMELSRVARQPMKTSEPSARRRRPSAARWDRSATDHSSPHWSAKNFMCASTFT